MITPDEALGTLEERPRVVHRPSSAERLNLGGEEALLRGEESTTIIMNGVILPIGSLSLQTTTQLSVAGVHTYAVASISPP